MRGEGGEGRRRKKEGGGRREERGGGGIGEKKDSGEGEQGRKRAVDVGKGKERMKEGSEECEERLVCLSVSSQLPQWWSSELQPCQSRPRDSVPQNGCQTPAGPTQPERQTPIH